MMVQLDADSLRALFSGCFESIIKPVLERQGIELAAIEQRRAANHQENSDKRHAANNTVQGLTLQIAEQKLRLDGHDAQFRALSGDGMGNGGALNELKDGQRKQGEKIDQRLDSQDEKLDRHGRQLDELNRSQTTIIEKIGNLESRPKTLTHKAKDFLTILTLLIAIITALWAVLTYVAPHPAPF